MVVIGRFAPDAGSVMDSYMPFKILKAFTHAGKSFFIWWVAHGRHFK